MPNPREQRAVKAVRQEDTRKMVEREVTAILGGRGPQTEVEWAFAVATYNHDKRMVKI